MTEALSLSWDRWSTGFWWQGVVGVWLFGQVGWQRDDSWSSVSSSCLQRQYLQNEIRHDFSDKARERLMCYTFLVKSICALCVCVSVSVRLFECLCWSISTMIQKNFSICWRWTECMVNIYIYIYFGHYLTNTAPCWLVKRSSETYVGWRKCIEVAMKSHFSCVPIPTFLLSLSRFWVCSVTKWSTLKEVSLHPECSVEIE